MLDRRHFLQVGSLPLFRPLLTLGAVGAGLKGYAQSASDYKALVCVYLFGGNDGYNTLVPHESSAHAQYLTKRPLFNQANQLGVGITQESLLTLPLANGQTTGMALNPALVNMHSAWASGRLAWVQEVGNLVEPLTRSNFAAARKPAALLAHDDQQELSMLASQFTQGLGTESGWGNRMLQHVLPQSDANWSQVSFFGNNRWQANAGWSTPVLLNALSTLPVVRSDAMRSLIADAERSSRPFSKAYASLMRESYEKAAVINALFASNNSLVDTSFTNALGGSPMASHFNKQLLSVAKLIHQRQSYGAPARQIFFVGLGGFDHHGAQFNSQKSYLTDIDKGLHAFFAALTAVGLERQVTAFSMSDFGRTMSMNASQGTDHGWASHHFVWGGAVRQGLYGQRTDWANTDYTVPTSPDVLMPRIALDQYAATLASWMGLSGADLNNVFPNLRNFSQPNLGFMNS
ncbi:DUF1501 domain-containing protein [Limnohabitans lacus]|uniref:DUF1501 domain-containing protein n=1 Tax=Limnohabitans lacus TaxID=3045173 RepID=A0ABT6XAP4_9BURK|nr:DUF1501 domain-containing protein [Limnohabitans sp. HM2-2]MDI9235207.1 DUF1501 domain-containing protein [Limnohabitans sp. HM2-2]